MENLDRTALVIVELPTEATPKRKSIERSTLNARIAVSTKSTLSDSVYTSKAANPSATSRAHEEYTPSRNTFELSPFKRASFASYCQTALESSRYAPCNA